MTGFWRSTQKMAKASVPIASSQSTPAITRNPIALLFASGVGFDSRASSALLAGVDSTRTTFLSLFAMMPSKTCCHEHIDAGGLS